MNFLCVFVSASFCQKAREVLDGLGTMYTVVDLDEEENGMAIKAELAGIIGRTSVSCLPWRTACFRCGPIVLDAPMRSSCTDARPLRAQSPAGSHLLWNPSPAGACRVCGRRVHWRLQ